MENKKEQIIEGLGGWLIIPIVGLFISIPLLLYDLLSVNLLYEFSFFMGLLSFLDIILLIWVVIALFSIFNKKKYTPQVMISFYIANIMIQIVVALLIQDISVIMYSVIGYAIWIQYFLVSKRVKNTFKLKNRK